MGPRGLLASLQGRLSGQTRLGPPVPDTWPWGLLGTAWSPAFLRVRSKAEKALSRVRAPGPRMAPPTEGTCPGLSEKPPALREEVSCTPWSLSAQAQLRAHGDLATLLPPEHAPHAPEEGGGSRPTTHRPPWAWPSGGNAGLEEEAPCSCRSALLTPPVAAGVLGQVSPTWAASQRVSLSVEEWVLSD